MQPVFRIAVAAAGLALPAVLPPPAHAADPGAGAVLAFGTAHHGQAGAASSAPIVAVAATPTGGGYWQVAANGGIFAFGDARFHGSTGGLRLNRPVVDAAPTPAGDGYWLVASDGGIFAFGDARFHGSTGGLRLNRPIVGMAPTPTGDGYWLVASDGGIFGFGDAAYLGSLGGTPLRAPIVGMAATPTGAGYWLVGADGGVFAFGDALFHGAGSSTPVVDMVATPTGRGYHLATADGAVLAFGDAVALGGAGGATVVAIASSAAGYWLATGRPRVDLGTFEATCYSLRGTTASGRPVGEDVVAVDPRLIPLGTRLHVEGQGERIAADTGGNIDGRRIDVWKPTSTQCAAFGRRSLRVWRLS